jgi:tetratricopeptide (TPR) repeat protein
VLAAGILFELCEMVFAERRAVAFERLKHAAPWFAASYVATLANPWGWRIYEAIYRQNTVMKVHSALIGEWSAVQFNSLALRQALDARSPASADWWLLGACGIAILAAVGTKRVGPAIVLAAGTYLSIQHIRLEALFAILAAIVGGGVLSELARTLSSLRPAPASESENPVATVSSGKVSLKMALGIVCVLSLLVGIRVANLISESYYVDSGQIALFGTGPSWWYPERAAAFLKREHLPANIFHDYNLGGYLTWRIGPEYQDFVDGRYIPFRKELFAEQRLLASLGPETSEWQQAAERWHINTVIFPISRYAGLGTFPLADFCHSDAWKPVYLDDVSVIYLRNRPENANAIRRLGISCENAPIEPPATASGNSFRARAERFNYLMNAASIFYLLSRDAEAASMLGQAEQLFPDSPNLHLVKAQMFMATSRLAEAEREYQEVVSSSPSDAAWFALAHLYADEHRYPEALRCVKEAESLSQVPYERMRSEGTLYVYMNQPQEALAAFERARKTSPYNGDSSDLGKEFNAQVAEGRARAYRELNKLDRAVEQQELATRLSPENPRRWVALAELYEAQGQATKGAQAREKAQAIQGGAAELTKPSEAQKNR